MNKYLITILLVLSFLSNESHAQLNTRNILDMGKSAIYFDDYTEAINNFNEIIRVKPYLPEPYFFRALAKYNLEDYQGANRDYTKAIAINPNYTLAYIYRGIARHQLKNHEGALSDFDRAAKLKPNMAIIFANRGISLSAQKRYKEAEKDYSKAIKLDHKLMGAFLNRAAVRDQLKNYEGAIEDCNKAIRLNNFSADAFGTRGYIKFKQKKYKEAIEDYNRALKIEPEDTRILMSRGMARYHQKDLKGTMEDYNKVLELDPSNAICFYNRALLKSEIGDYNSAIDDFNKVLEMNPDNILIYFNRGMIKSDLGDFYGAIDDYTTAIGIYPDFAKAYQARASAKRQLNDMDGAIRDHNQAIIIFDRYKKMKSNDKMSALVDTTENFQNLVDINNEDNFTDKIIKGRIQDKNVIIQLEDNFAITHMSMDSLRAGKMQYYDQNLMNYNQHQNYEPAFALSNKNKKYSREEIREWIEKETVKINEKKTSSNFFNRGVYQLMDQKYNQAILDFTQAIEKDPTFVFAYFNRATAKAAMTDYIHSLEENTGMTVSLRPNKTDADSKEEIVIDYSSAIEDYNKILEIDSSFIFARYNRANALAKSRKLKEALLDYEKVIQMDPHFAQAYYNRGLIYIYQDEKEKAYEDLSKAGELGLLNAYNVIKRYCNKKK
ncbi:MAG: tetratricopeptide repeat protein [Marinifilaceae bacterium]